MRERYLPTTHEIKQLLTFLAPTIAIGYVAFGAFTTEARKEIGRRDRWTCQYDGCDRDFRSGYMVTAAHYPDVHQYTGRGYHDKDTRNGRILCQVHHALEEIERGNKKGAELLLSRGIYTEEYAKNNGGNVYLTVEDLEEYGVKELLYKTLIPEYVYQTR